MRHKLLGFLFLCATLLSSAAHAQDRTISGKVTDENGQSLPGVSVLVPGTTVGTQTDNNGNYTLSVPASARFLTFRFVGYAVNEVAIGTSNVINVKLVSSSEELAEVIVQAPYGAIRKTAFTGSESTISARNFENQQVASFTRALEGVAPGVQATNGGGAPGTNADIRIRGIGSVNADASPLYVVDGVPYVGSNISLSTDDIETTTVLKDAAATALYGSRAANGVIMITTKKGRDAAPELSFTARTGFVNRAIPEYDRVNIPQYYEGMWHATYNREIRTLLPEEERFPTPQEAAQSASDGLIAGALIYNATNQPNNLVVLPTGQFNPDAGILYQDDWQGELFHQPFRQDYNLNVRGGTNEGNYFISMGYLNEPGYVRHTAYERFTGRVNVESKIKDWLSAGLNADGALGYQDNLLAEGTYTSNPFYYSRIMGPIYPIWQRDQGGNIVIDPLTGEQVYDWGTNAQMGARPYAGNSNLVGSLALDDRSGKVGNLNFNTFLEAKFLKDFTFRTTLGGNYFNRYGTTFQNSEFGDAANVSGRSTKNHTRQLSFTFNQILTYDKTFDEDHHLNVLVGHENYQNTRNFLYATRSGFPFPGNTELGPAATLEAASSYEDYHRIEGYLSRANYTYKDRYLFSASFRRDGSSRFYPGLGGTSGNQWGNFYSIGAGWRLSEEDFLQDVSWVNELKLRGSYGEQGNEGIQRSRPSGETDQENPINTNIDNYYGWQSLYTFGWNNVNFPGVLLSSLPNQDLTWEKNKNLNLGLDFTLFGNRLDGTIEWYNRESDNLLFQVPLPLSSGGLSTGEASIWRNVGAMYNRGIEIQLGYNAIRQDDFDWRIDLNLSHYSNKVTRLAPENEADGIVSGTKRIAVGEDVYRFWLREYAGVNPDNGDALWYVDVLDGDGNPTGERTTTNNVNSATYYYHGSAIPDLFGGLTNSFRYKDFDLSVLLTFQIGGQFYDGNYASLMHMGSYGSNWHTDILDAWKQPGDITDVPRLQNGIAAANAGNAQSSRFLFDASYLNIKNITFGYNLPRHLISDIGLTRLRVFANVDNAHIFTSRKGMDPQRAFTGVSDFTYPTMRNFTFGVTVGL